MTSRLDLLILVIVMLFAATSVFGQENPVINPADSSSVLTFATGMLDQLYDGNPNAADWISWNYFSVNGTFLGTDYEATKDDVAKAAFINDTLSSIYNDLHYVGDQNDAYDNWNISYGEEYITVTANNDKKKVSMDFQSNASDSIFLNSITIEDR